MKIHFRISENAGICRDNVCCAEEVIMTATVSEDDIHKFEGNKDAVISRYRVALASNLGCENEDVKLIGTEGF